MKVAVGDVVVPVSRGDYSDATYVEPLGRGVVESIKGTRAMVRFGDHGVLICNARELRVTKCRNF